MFHRLLICLLLWASFSFADSDWDRHIKRFGMGVDVAVWEGKFLDITDFSFVVSMSADLTDRVRLNFDAFNFHMVSDEPDSTCRMTGLASLVSIAMFPFIFFDEANSIFGLLTALNPTLEFFLWKKFVPVSVAAGYKADWFLFSPDMNFYFRPHVGLNVYAGFALISASYSYMVTNTYDAKRGSMLNLGLFFSVGMP